MITTVTLNPCIDRTMNVSSINEGGYNAVISSREDFAGKGINVSSALSNFSLENTAITLDFLDSGRGFASWLSTQSFYRRLVPVPGKIRTNIKLFDESTSSMTEFNERGQFLEDSAISNIWNALMDAAKTSFLLVLSGSICPGIPERFYKDVIEAVRSVNPSINIILDASGAPFVSALSASPTLIKPNLFELESTFNVKLSGPKEISNFSQQLCAKYGIGIVCVSLGKDGAIISSAEESFQAQGLTLPIQSAQGAGDAMVAGISRGMLEGQDLSGLLRYGMASSAATIVKPGTLMGTEADFRRFYPQISIIPII